MIEHRATYVTKYFLRVNKVEGKKMK